MAKKKGKKRARLRLEDLHLEPWQRAEIEKQLGRAIGPGGAGGGDGERDVVGLEVAVDDPLTDRDLKPAKTTARGGRGGRNTGHKQGMNATEAAYAEHLELRRLAGNVFWFGFEAFRIRLADNTFYRPDFAVLAYDDSVLEHGGPARLEFHEVKGHWEDAARVKIKVAAEHLPFVFLAVKKRAKRDGGGWDVERLPGLAEAAR